MISGSFGKKGKHTLVINRCVLLGISYESSLVLFHFVVNQSFPCSAFFLVGRTLRCKRFPCLTNFSTVMGSHRRSPFFTGWGMNHQHPMV